VCCRTPGTSSADCGDRLQTDPAAARTDSVALPNRFDPRSGRRCGRNAAVRAYDRVAGPTNGTSHEVRSTARSDRQRPRFAPVLSEHCGGSTVNIDDRIERRLGYDVGAGVLVDIDAVSPMSHTESPVGRGPGIERLLDVFEPAFAGSLPPSAYVHGPKGREIGDRLRAVSTARIPQRPTPGDSDIDTSGRADAPRIRLRRRAASTDAVPALPRRARRSQRRPRPRTRDRHGRTGRVAARGRQHRPRPGRRSRPRERAGDAERDDHCRVAHGRQRPGRPGCVSAERSRRRSSGNRTRWLRLSRTVGTCSSNC